MPDLPVLSCSELDQAIQDTITDIQADIDAYDESAAIRDSGCDDGKTTDRRALDALQRAERFRGEHEVAVAWLFNSPTARIWGAGE